MVNTYYLVGKMIVEKEQQGKMRAEYGKELIQKLIGQKIPVLSMPDEIDQPVTPYEEQQVILREVDMQRRKEDPTYQGAFHERKDKTEAKKVVKKGARKSVKKYFSK